MKTLKLKISAILMLASAIITLIGWFLLPSPYNAVLFFALLCFIMYLMHINDKDKKKGKEDG